MKSKQNVSYFPVSGVEQMLLLRVREADLSGRVDGLLAMLDQIAEANLSAADLDQAIQLLAESRQGEGMDARFDNLEARLKERIERGLTEIEGRLSKRMAADVATTSPSPAETRDVSGQPTPLAPSTDPSPSMQGTPRASSDGGVPKEASIAFRVGSELLWATSAAQFYVAVWRWLFENDRARLADLPIRSGKKRFVVAAAPVHPSGKDFTRAEEPVPGVFIEVNLSRNDIIRRSKKYLAQFGTSFEVVVGDG